MSVNNWSYYYKENKETLTKRWFVDTISLWVSIGLVWFAFLQIIGEKFPSYAEVNLLLLGLYVVLLWLPASGLLNRFGERWNMIASVAGVLFPLGYIFIHHKKVYDGVLEVVNTYLYRFNPYQGTNLSLPAGEEEYVPYVLTAVYMILWMALWGMSNSLKRPVLMILLPVLAVFLEFLVGTSPEPAGLICIFVAAFMFMIPKGTKLLRQVVVIVMAVISINAAEMVFDEEIDEFSTGREVIENWWEDFEFPTIQLDNFLQLDFVVNKEHVDNHKPNYTGKVMFKISTGTRPQTNQYLRGFCATDYQNGSWSWDRTIFRQACEDAGYSESAIAQILSSNPFFILGYSATYDKLAAMVDVNYVSTTGDTVYLPYMFTYRTMDENYTFTGDYLIKKNITDKQITAKVGGFGDLVDLSKYTYYAKFSGGYDEMLWYNKVAQKYTERSDDIDFIDDAAYFIKTQVSRPTEESLWLDSSTITYDGECLKALLENMYRMKLAAYVRGYLAAELDYSLDLDKISSKEDPVEYALTRGKEGYCMHYASAAVLIFKELGVPARYASGYIVRPSDYKLDADAGKYVAKVEDYSGHAWAEIYLENIGWVPIEVTEGYEDSTGDLPTKKDTEESSENPTETEPTETNPTETEPTETEPTETDPTETEPTETAPTETEPTEENPTETQPTESIVTENSGGDTQQGGGAGTAENKELWENIFKAAGVLILVFGFIYGCKLALVYYDYVLKREIDGEQTRKAVKRMNKRIARIMRITNWKNGQLTDAMLEEVLKKNYPQVSEDDWNRYMEIVKKMHYSKEQITHEEMMHVYWCYKNI
ncbi:MAG: transglutaminase domain-containing protein [Lachnospiraceae bacterium]|nr:transglutaminase domain-containing protein [Lachnospiraceae bacterium]